MLFKLLDYKYTGILCMLLVLGYFSVEMFGLNKQTFLPGQTTSAHHQIELACDQCHTPIDGVKQDVCLDCHGDALKEVEDSHAVTIFNDPRSFAMLEKIDAKQCVTCHAEHLDDQNGGKIAAVANDFCFACHEDIAEERPSHKDLPADGCSASGCHNYHDNTALYEDFVKKHVDEDDLLMSSMVPLRNYAELHRLENPHLVRRLEQHEQDAPVLKQDEDLIKQWANSGHAQTAVNCMDCHQSDTDSDTLQWTDQPAIKVCEECHDKEAEHFYQGKHGMRLAVGLSPMKPELARIPMKQQAAHEIAKELTCHSCHSAHDYNTQTAAVESCLGCHADTHSKAYLKSSHYQLWLKEVSGELPAGSGVSCASCHLPRLLARQNGKDKVWVNHNQNANLRPNSKMIRGVCMQCHGLNFSLQSLADNEQLLNNYSSPVAGTHKTIEMVQNRMKKSK